MLLEGDEERAAADRGEHARAASRSAGPPARRPRARAGPGAAAAGGGAGAGPAGLCSPAGSTGGVKTTMIEVERVVAEPGPAVGHHRQHHHQLDREGDPGDPVERDPATSSSSSAGMRLGDRHHRHRQRRRDHHRRVEPFGDPGAARVHPGRVAHRLRLRLRPHPRLIRRAGPVPTSKRHSGPEMWRLAGLRNDKTRRSGSSLGMRGTTPLASSHE